MSDVRKVGFKKDILEGKSICVEIENKAIAIFNIKGQFYAFENECTHAGGPLSDGEIDGHVVTCPWHGATFDVTTGAALSAPAFDALKSFKVHTEGDEIRIEI